MPNNQRNIVEMWPVVQDDLKKFLSDRPGWFIDTLKKAREKKGARGWKDVEVVTNILQFLKDTEVEY